MDSTRFDMALSIGGAAGQGIATPGNILARIFIRRGLRIYAYNAYQSIIRGGHIFLTLRTRDQEVRTHGDGIDLLLCLNQDTMDRHLRILGPGARVLFNGDKIQPGDVPDTCADVQSLSDAVGYRPATTVEVGVKRFVEWYLDYYRVDLPGST